MMINHLPTNPIICRCTSTSGRRNLGEERLYQIQEEGLPHGEEVKIKLEEIALRKSKLLILVKDFKFNLL